MFEVAVRSYPFAKRLREFKSEGGKGMDIKLMREIAIGKRRIQLEGEVDGVSPAFKQRESFVGVAVEIEQQLRGSVPSTAQYFVAALRLIPTNAHQCKRLLGRSWR